MIRPVSPRTRTGLLASVSISALCLVLGACGSEAKASGVPSLNGANGNASASATTTTVDPQKAAQSFVACLRKNGLDVADPKIDSNGQIDFRSIFESADVQPGSDEFREAQTACRSILANAGFGPSPAEQKARSEALLAFTSCLRKQGLDVGDISFDGPGGGGGGFGGPPGGGDPSGGGAQPGQNGSGSTTTTLGSTGNNSTGAGRPERGGPPATPEERQQRLAEQLGLDPNDAQVKEAFTACNTELEAATARPGSGSTTTTAP